MINYGSYDFGPLLENEAKFDFRSMRFEKPGGFDEELIKLKDEIMNVSAFDCEDVRYIDDMDVSAILDAS